MKTNKVKIKKGDQVVVIAGNDKDLQGPREVIKVFPSENKAIVKGVKMISRHTKPNSNNTKGSIIKKEAPIHLSNVMLWDSNVKQGTKVRFEIDDKGNKQRMSKKSDSKI